MSEEYLREHDLSENVVPGKDESIFFNMEIDKIQHFEELLEKRLVHTADEKGMVQAVVMAALETEGIQLDRPEVIIESVMANPDVKTEAIRFAEKIMKKNIQ